MTSTAIADSTRVATLRYQSGLGTRASYGLRAAQKTICDDCGLSHQGWYDRKRHQTRDLACAGRRIYLEFEIRRVECRGCGEVKQERIDFLADNQHYTKRFMPRSNWTIQLDRGIQLVHGNLLSIVMSTS